MKTMLRMLYRNKGFWSRQNKRSLYLGLLLLALALVIQVNAGRYSARRALSSNFVGDVFLDNLPVVDLDFVIVQGAILILLVSIVLFATRPHELLFAVKAVALFIVIRSFFIDLTHVGLYPADFYAGGAGSRIYNAVTFNGNFFFSAHTGLPFLLALIFWHEKSWRFFFLGVSVFFGTSVLLAHVHYSIDVFAAPFITYSIFKLTAKLFPRDYGILVRSIMPRHE